MKLDKSPFVIISVIGQELLAAGYHASSLVVLESALKIGKIQRNNGWTFGDTDQAKYRGGKKGYTAKNMEIFGILMYTGTSTTFDAMQDS